MFLTATDLHALTGYALPAYQRRWLAAHGWPFEESRFGHPKVLRAFAERKMGLADSGVVAQTEPDFSHWKAA